VAAKTKIIRKSSVPNFSVGSPVLILRPHLWGGCAGEVESVKDGVHLIKIAGKDGATFHAEALSDELRLDL